VLRDGAREGGFGGADSDYASWCRLPSRPPKSSSARRGACLRSADPAAARAGWCRRTPRVRGCGDRRRRGPRRPLRDERTARATGRSTRSSIIVIQILICEQYEFRAAAPERRSTPPDRRPEGSRSSANLCSGVFQNDARLPLGLLFAVRRGIERTSKPAARRSTRDWVVAVSRQCGVMLHQSV